MQLDVGDIYATMQLDVLGPPPHAPPTEAPLAPTLPRYDRHPRPPHLDEDHEARLHEEMRRRDHFVDEKTHTMRKGVLDAESDDDDEDDLVSSIVGWKKPKPTALPAASLPRAATPQPLDPASSAASSAVGDDEAGSSEAHAASGDAASTPAPAADARRSKINMKSKHRGPRLDKKTLKRGAPSTAPVQDGSPKRQNTPEFAASRPPTPLGTGAHAYAAHPQRVATPMPPRPSKRPGSPASSSPRHRPLPPRSGLTLNARRPLPISPLAQAPPTAQQLDRPPAPTSRRPPTSSGN
jgi:hypothetical protein